MNLYALRKSAAEAKLDELDPEWRERFQGDWQRAEDFYRPKRLTGLGHPEQPPEVCDCADPFCEDNDDE